MILRRIALFFPVTLLIATIGSQAAAQQCSGKRIEFRLRVCSQTACEGVRQSMIFVGDKIIYHDENPETGLVFQVGRTIEYSEADVPIAREIIAESGVLARARVSATASFADNLVRLRRNDVFYNRKGDVGAEAFTLVDVEITDCRTCRVRNLEMHFQRVPKYRLAEHRSCEVSNAK